MPNDADNKPDRNNKKEETPQSLEKMPDSVRSFFSIFGRRPIFPPFMEKITEEHITKILEISEKQDERDFEDLKSQRRYRFATFLGISVLFVFLLVFLTIYLVDRDKDLYKDIIKIGLGVLSGLAAGYGLAKRSSNKDQE